MKRILPLVFLAASLVVVIGCSAGQEPLASGLSNGLTPNQEAQAKSMGIATSNGVKQDAGPYSDSVNFAKSGIEAQQRRSETENMAVKALSGPPH